MEKRSLFEHGISKVPWYLTLLISLGLYIASFFVKDFKAGIMPVGPAFSIALKFFAGFFFIIAVLSFIISLFNKSLLKNSKSLEDIKKLSWVDFENLIEAYYRQKGYKVVHSGANSADGGIDIIASKDGEKIIIQCKHWKAYKVDVKVVREIYGLMVAEKASKAVVITLGDFTQPAVDFASDKPVELINGEKFVKLISEVNESKVKNTSKNNLNTADKNVVLCPECGSPMVLRVAKHGEYAGKKFWGCSNYPKCKHIIPVE